MELAQEVAVAATRSAAEDVIRALESLPDYRRGWRPGGVANHPVGIVAHCAVSARFFAAIFAGKPIPYRTQAERSAAVAAIETSDQARNALRDAVTELCDAIGGLESARLSEPMIMPWGERMPYARGILAPAFHLQYHAGQINYLQCLTGDDEYH